jgi:transposase-like protein
MHRLHIANGLKARFTGRMPWPTRVLLTMKKEFIMLALQPGANPRELSRRYGISAPCGYKWLRAYQEGLRV